MPTLESDLHNEAKLRLLLYGPAKVKKTLLAGTAAEAGFNILFLDCDGNFQILRNLSAEARKRIYRIDIQDEPHRAIAAVFLGLFSKYDSLYWDIERKEIVMRPQLERLEQTIKLNHSIFDSNWFIVLDSYTALTSSLVKRFALENKIDLTDAKKTEWEGYRWAGTLALTILKTLKETGDAHLAVIGHKTIYEKYKGKGNDRQLEYQREQVISTSGPHAMMIPKEFSDVLKFSVQGNLFKVDSRPAADSDGGGCSIPPDIYNWDDITIPKIVKLLGIKTPPKDLPYPEEYLKVTEDDVKPVRQVVQNKGILVGNSQKKETQIDEKVSEKVNDTQQTSTETPAKKPLFGKK